MGSDYSLDFSRVIAGVQTYDHGITRPQSICKTFQEGRSLEAIEVS